MVVLSLGKIVGKSFDVKLRKVNFYFRAWEAIVIGAFAAFITIITVPMWCKLGVDDPIAATSVHLLGGVVGLLSVGLFAESPDTLSLTGGRSGLFKSKMN